MYDREIEKTLKQMIDLGWVVDRQIPSDFDLIYRLNRNGNSFDLKRMNLHLAQDIVNQDLAIEEAKRSNEK